MSEPVAAAPMDEPPKASWLGHNAPRLLILSACLGISAVFWPTSLGALIVGLSILNLTLSVVIIFTWIRHDNRLCDFCHDEFPVDGEIQAERYHRRFRVVHSLIAIGAIVLSTMVLPIVLPDSWAYAASIAGNSFLIYWSVAFLTHRRLQFWCPFCRDDGDWDDPVPEPAPDPSMQRDIR